MAIVDFDCSHLKVFRCANGTASRGTVGTRKTSDFARLTIVQLGSVNSNDLRHAVIQAASLIELRE